MPLPSILRWSLLGLAICAGTHSVRGQERSFASLLPQSTIAYLEVAPAEQWIDHPLRLKIQSSDAFLRIWSSPDVMKLRGAITLAELAMGDSLDGMVGKLASGGLAIAVDREQEGGILIARTEDQAWLDDYLKRLVKLARDHATGSGKPDPVKQTDYRGLTVYQLDQVIIAGMDEYLLVTNKQELGKAIVDRHLDGTPGGLIGVPHFMRMSEGRSANGEQSVAEQEIAWSFVDVQMLRDAGVANQLLDGRANDFAGELILGGVLATLHRTPVITGSLTFAERVIGLSFAAPHETAWSGEEREFFFGPQGQGTALPPLAPAQKLASLSVYRDLAQLWLRAGDLFNERVNDQLAQAESTLTTLFSGRDFGEDILGALEPQLRVVVSRQEFTDDQLTPAIRLPSFALIAQLRDPELMRGELKRIFQSLVGFLNIVGASNGQPQLDLGMEYDGPQQFVTAQYVPEVDRPAGTDVPVQFNFSPTVAFVGDTVIFSSTIALSKEVAQMLHHSSSGPVDADRSGTGMNTLLEIDGPVLYQSLQDNRGQLIAKNMLEKGHTREEAEQDTQLILSIISLVKELRVQLGFNEHATLSADLTFAE